MYGACQQFVIDVQLAFFTQQLYVQLPYYEFSFLYEM